MFVVQGFKLKRKSRDPAKEIAEWNKIKGLANRPKGMYNIITCVGIRILARPLTNGFTPFG